MNVTEKKKNVSSIFKAFKTKMGGNIKPDSFTNSPKSGPKA